MCRKLLLPAAFAGVLLVASDAWAPPPPRPAPRPVPPPSTRPPTTRPSTTRPPTGGTVRPPAAKPAFHKSFEAARAKSAAEAAHLLRTQGIFLARAERAAMLNLVAHQMLRQPQPASLVDLRRLRADWHATGPGVGLDPLVAMELEAAESGAERLVLAEILRLVRDGQFAEADQKCAALDSPRYLPAAVVQALPELRQELKRVAPARGMQVALARKQPQLQDVMQHVAHVTPETLPQPIRTSSEAWAALVAASELFENIASNRTRSRYQVVDFERVLIGVKASAGDTVAGKLRAEAAAALFLDGRLDDATELLGGEVDPAHAASVLADLRAVILGRGEITIAQVAAFVPPDAKPPAQSVAVLPADQLAKWQPPARKTNATTLNDALADAKKQLKVAVNAEVAAATAKVNAVADRIRSALAAEAAPVKPFIEKVQALRGGDPLTAAERHLAAVAGSRGLTVAEAVGVLSAEADRPASAARLLAAVPVVIDPGTFAVRVEVAGYAPAAFQNHADAGFKLTGAHDRARARAAVATILGAEAAKVAAGREGEPLGRAALEAEVVKRLGLPPDALTAAECVQALLDVCRDWADEHARLRDAARDLDAVIADIDSGRYESEGEDVGAVFALAKAHRLTVQNDRNRREAGISAACRLLGDYGAAARPAIGWLAEQGQDKPWRGSAREALARIKTGDVQSR